MNKISDMGVRSCGCALCIFCASLMCLNSTLLHLPGSLFIKLITPSDHHAVIYTSFFQ